MRILFLRRWWSAHSYKTFTTEGKTKTGHPQSRDSTDLPISLPDLNFFAAVPLIGEQKRLSSETVRPRLPGFESWAGTFASGAKSFLFTAAKRSG